MRTLTASCSLLLAAFLLTNCNKGADTAKQDDKTLINTDFDGFQGWVNNGSGSLTNKYAHSGRYSITVGGGKEYGLTFGAPLGQLMAAKPRKVHVQGWVRVEEANTPVQLVVQVTKPGTDEKVFWKGLPLSAGTKVGQWTELKSDITLPDNVAFDQLLGVYMWGNNAGKPVYLDDLRIVSAD